MNIEKLSLYATDRQKEILIAIQSEGSENKAAALLGLNPSTVNKAYVAVKNKAAMSGWSPDHDMTHEVPDGFKLKGTSTLYDSQTGQAKIQWVKTNADQSRQDEIFKEALSALAEALPKEKPIDAPNYSSENLAVCFPIGDFHLGLKCWNEEVGADFDLSIGENLLIKATDSLMSSSPACDTAFICVLGDFLHWDGMEAVTPAHRNILDADNRYPKVVRAAIKLVRYMIRSALIKHSKVHVVIAMGNHDPSSSVFLAECLKNIYELELRVTVDTQAGHYKYWKFGRNLIGVHHGDKAKQEKLPQLMAFDRPMDWGNTDHRFYWSGHTHHQSVKDIMGVNCESFRVLPPADAYAVGAGYRSIRDMKSIVIHKQFGEVARYTVNPIMLED